MSDGPLFMHLLQRHLDDLLDSNAYSIALIKEEIGLVKEDLEFIRSFFANIEQGLYKDLWARVLDVAYEAKDVIDSIIVRDNGLLHLIFSLPITIKRIRLIKEEVSDLHEKIPKKRGPLADSVSETFHLRHLRVLRALELPSFFMVKDTLLYEICMLNHLRFLCIGTEIKSLPLSLSNLWNLEILAVYNEGSTLVLLPRIWDLVKLRVITMSACSFFDVDADGSILIAEDTKLENLRCLHKLVLPYSKDTEHIFKMLPNLQLLQFDLKESWDYSTEQYWFPKLDCLTELEELEVCFVRSNTNDTNRPWDFHFPSSLKKLWLLDFPLTSDSLSTIARLPNLEVLSLYRTIIHGEEWNMGEEDTFENLKCLKLHQVTLSKWEVGEESFPALEKLKLEGCSDLEEIPPSFGDNYSLKIITLVESPQLEDSAMKIKEYAEDMRGGEELQVVGWNNIPLFK